MRIVVFYKYFRTYGGQEKVVYSLVHFLAKKGYQIDVYSLRVDDTPIEKNITVHRVRFLSKGWTSTLFFSVFSCLKGKKLKKLYDDVCIFGFGKTFCNDIFRAGGGVHLYYFKRAILKKRTSTGRLLYKIRKIFSLTHWITIFVENLTFRNSKTKIFIVPSNFVKMQLVDIYNVDENKIEVVRNGVDLNRFYFSVKEKKKQRRKYRLEDDEFIFCFVSTNHRLKGLQYLLTAVKVLKDKKYRFKLVIAGSGHDTYFLKLIKKLSIDDFIIWAGKRKDIENIYRIGDVLVYPTLFDAASSVVLEAMACGLVPVVSKYNGTSEIVKNGENGFIIEDPTNVNEIANIMEFLLKNKDIIPQLRENALKSIRQYPADDVFSKIEEIIRKNCGAETKQPID